MDFRIIEITRKKEKRDVKIPILIRRNDSQNVAVEASVRGNIRTEAYNLECREACQAFIRDFSKRSASEFYSRNNY